MVFTQHPDDCCGIYFLSKTRLTFVLTVRNLSSIHIKKEVMSFHNLRLFDLFTYIILLSTEVISIREFTLHRQIVFNFGSCEFIDHAVGDS